MVIAYTVAGAAVVVLGLAGLLRLCKTVGERLADSGDTAPAPVRPLVARVGYLSPEEEAAAAATAKDVARLAAVQRYVEHRSNRLFEWALSELRLDQQMRNVVRAGIPGYPLVGAR